MRFWSWTARHRATSLTAAAAVIAAFGLTAPVVASAAGAGGTRSIPAGGTTSIRASGTGVDALQQPELRPGTEESEGEAGQFARVRPGMKNGKFPPHPLDAPVVASSAVAATNPDVAVSVNGLNHRDQRLANGGNQFSVEPPDQALCVGNGYVLEGVNSVLQVRNTSGAALTGAQDINTFFGYPAAINRTTGVIGPDVIDPVCLYDPDNQRFMVVITTLATLPNGDFTGKNTIDLAVSNTGNPTGTWTIYHIPAQNDGTDGTPNHGCTLDGVTPGPCFQDYPHIGADANGVYVSTNEYDLFGPSYNAAQIFAFSKAQLAAHPASINMTPVENLVVDGSPGFTVWPAQSPVGQNSAERNGTEYLMSTIAGDGSETGNPTGTARRIGIWAITNTASLNTASPALEITSRLTNSQTYVVPPKADQKTGDIPLGECINDTTLPTPFGPGCWQVLLNPPAPAHDEVESSPDSLDSRMQQTWYVNGTLWGSSGTAVRVNGEVKAGIAWFAVSPKINGSGKIQGTVKNQGYIALADNNLTMPALAMTPSGAGAIAFSVLGKDYYPSAGYVRISADGTVGPIHIAAQGLGPHDGFTAYKAFVGNPPRTRWGDYGAAVTDGANIWLASEYIGQTCTLAQYFPAPPSTAGFGSCGGTRTSLGNWYTRITKLSQ